MKMELIDILYMLHSYDIEELEQIKDWIDSVIEDKKGEDEENDN